MTLLGLVVAAILMVANGFFVAIEFCLVAASPTAIEVMADDGNKRAKRALGAFSDISRQVAGSQLGITMASLGLGIVAEPAIEHLIEPALGFLGESVRITIATVLSLGLVAFFHMMIGEMVPKNLCLANPNQTAVLLLPIHRRFVTIMSPAINILHAITSWALNRLNVTRVDERVQSRTPAQLAGLLEQSRGEGVLDDFEHQLLAGALDLGESVVETVAVPWDQVATIPVTATVADAEAAVTATGHSRFPLINPDAPLVDPVGWVHAKDLLGIDAAARAEPLPSGLIRPLMQVRSDRPLEEVLVRMQRDRRHFAVVRSGKTITGIVTLEDVLESVVGEINDETDLILAPLENEATGQAHRSRRPPRHRGGQNERHR